MKKLIFILFLSYLFVNNVNALTLQEWHMNQNEDGNIVTYNAGNGAFEYLGQYYNTGSTNYDFTSFLFSSLPFKYTDSLNFYFDNPCSSTEKISYTNRIYFYKVSGLDLDLISMHIVNVIDGCTGYMTYENGQYVYVQTCSLNPNEPLATSLYFGNIPLLYNNATYYRLGLQSDFNYKCEIDEKSLIDNNNANTQQIINSQNNIDNSINNASTEINNNLTDESLPDTTNWLDSWTDLLLENNQVNQILYLPVNILNKVSFQSKNNCTPIVIPFGLTGGNETLTFNCWQITDYLGNTVGDLITGIVGFYLLYYFAMFLWKFYDDFTSLKDTLNLILSNEDSLIVKGDNNG